MSGLSVLSAESRDGVTVLVMGQQEGYVPIIHSIPASEYGSNVSHNVNNFEIPRFTSYIENPSVPEELKITYIAGHIEAMLDAMGDLVKESVPEVDACDVVAVGGLAIMLIHPPTTVGALAGHAVIHVAIDEACNLLLHGESEVYSFNSYHGGSLEDITMFIPADTNSDGFVYGNVVDAETGSGLESITIYLDGDLTTATLSEGGFSFAGLTPGSHTLTTESPGYAGSAESISAISGEVTRTDKIQLRAFNPGTLRINNLTGGIATIDVETQQLVDNPAGDFAKWLMPAGDYQLRAWTTACQGVAAAEVTIQPGQFVSLDVICTLNTVGYMSR